MGTQKRQRPPLYTRWRGMRQRCHDPNSTAYARYGGRGIQVCERWNDFTLFAQDVGTPPSPRHQLDRIDPNGHYEPGNVRWATPSQQARNTRRTRLTEAQVEAIRAAYVGGHGQCASLARDFGVSTRVIYNIVNGLTWIERVAS